MSYEEAGAYIDKLSKNSLTIRDHIWRTVNELGSAKAALQTLSARGLISSIEKQWPEENELRSADRLKSDPIWNRRDPQIPRSKWWNADSPFVGFRVIRPVKQPTKEEILSFFEGVLK